MRLTEKAFYQNLKKFKFQEEQYKRFKFIRKTKMKSIYTLALIATLAVASVSAVKPSLMAKDVVVTNKTTTEDLQRYTQVVTRKVVKQIKIVRIQTLAHAVSKTHWNVTLNMSLPNQWRKINTIRRIFRMTNLAIQRADATLGLYFKNYNTTLDRLDRQIADIRARIHAGLQGQHGHLINQTRAALQSYYNLTDLFVQAASNYRRDLNATVTNARQNIEASARRVERSVIHPAITFWVKDQSRVPVIRTLAAYLKQLNNVPLKYLMLFYPRWDHAYLSLHYAVQDVQNRVDLVLR